MDVKSDVEKQNSFQYFLQTVHKCLRYTCDDNPIEIDKVNNAVRTVQN